MMRSLTIRFAATVVAFTLCGLTTARAFEPRPEPYNHVVVVIDGSGSYRQRVAEAVGRVVALLTKMAEKRVHRWETALDRVTVISLDAVPAVLWEGTVADLKTIKSEDWTKRFQARTDYAACTDVGEAFRLAARAFAADDLRLVQKYLFVFSDLIDEPPTTSVARCRPVKYPSYPPQDFPWESLVDVSASVFWMPPDQVLAWKRAVAEHGLGTTFALHTDSESGAVEIAPPRRPTITMTAAEVAGTKSELRAFLASGGKWLFKIFVLIIVVPALLISAAMLVARRITRSRRVRQADPVSTPRPLPPPQGQGNRPLRVVPRAPAPGAGQSR
jgi:hypothetical protein